MGQFQSRSTVPIARLPLHEKWPKHPIQLSCGRHYYMYHDRELSTTPLTDHFDNSGTHKNERYTFMKVAAVRRTWARYGSISNRLEDGCSINQNTWRDIGTKHINAMRHAILGYVLKALCDTVAHQLHV